MILGIISNCVRCKGSSSEYLARYSERQFRHASVHGTDASDSWGSIQHSIAALAKHPREVHQFLQKKCALRYGRRERFSAACQSEGALSLVCTTFSSLV